MDTEKIIFNAPKGWRQKLRAIAAKEIGNPSVAFLIRRALVEKHPELEGKKQK